jgi:hypothetical protein
VRSSAPPTTECIIRRRASSDRALAVLSNGTSTGR